MNKYLEGLKLFNEEKFHESHDVLEEFWKEKEGDPHRTLYQGIIQSAVALYLVTEKRMVGALKVYKRAMKNLAPYTDSEGYTQGVNVSKLVDELRNYFENLEEKPNEKQAFFKIDFNLG